MKFKKVLQKRLVWKSYRNLNLYSSTRSATLQSSHTGANRVRKAGCTNPCWSRYVGQIDVCMKITRASPETQLWQISRDQHLTKYLKCNRHLMSAHELAQILPNYTAGWDDSASEYERLMHSPQEKELQSQAYLHMRTCFHTSMSVLLIPDYTGESLESRYQESWGKEGTPSEIA